jgi:type I restriction enzyme M protein
MDTLELLPFSHQSALRNIRNFLAGRLLGATRDRALMDELFKCVFAKHWLVKDPSLVIDGEVSKSYRSAFAHVKRVLPGVFLLEDEIELDPVALQYVNLQLEAIDLERSRADIFSEIYEVFGASGVKSAEGQFFTPSVAVELLIEMVDLKPHQIVCDPACGAGGFLIAAAKRLSAQGLHQKEIAHCIKGVEKDAYLARIAGGRLALFLDEMPLIHCGDSLAGVSQNGSPLHIQECDIILTNPPFGAKIVAASLDTLQGFELAKKWIKSGEQNCRFIPTTTVDPSTPPQVLFLERCLKLLKPNGILGAILPESLVSTKSYGFVVQYLKDQGEIIAVVGMPEALFKTSGKGGTHTKTVAIVVKKKSTKRRSSSVFFAEAKWCGHDSRGREVPLNDVPKIIANFAEFRNKGVVSFGYLGVSVPRERLTLSLAPRAFEFDSLKESESLSKTHEIISLGELVKDATLLVVTGDEIGKLAYGTGDIPFVRTSDISNWEIKLDPKHCISKEVYARYRRKQNVEPNDILMVKDGTYLIGTCAIITEYDLPMLFQSHLYKIRVNETKKINSFLLLAALSSDFVQRQIKSFCVSQDIIDSLGDKIYQLQLPIPKSKGVRQRITGMVEKVIRERSEARELARKACREILVG